MQPFRLTPACKDYLWGGTRLKTAYGKRTALPVLAQSWELSAHPAGDAVIACGEFAGTPFSRFAAEHPEALGGNCAGAKEFPILIKLIDAAQFLSIQVHPDDDYARRVEGGRGKTEMWYVVNCEPDAFLYFGFEREISAEEMRRRIANHTITEALHKAPVHKGDVFFIGAGTIHAIGAGILLAEIQQNSNTTYRVYDFGRVGADGKPRELHVDKALDVTLRAPAPAGAPGAEMLAETADFRLGRLAKCDYFTVDALALSGNYRREMTGDSFVSVLCTEGGAALSCGGEEFPLRAGESLFVPADAPGFALAGNGELLLTTV